jgi:hypothetical protein
MLKFVPAVLGLAFLAGASGQAVAQPSGTQSAQPKPAQTPEQKAYANYMNQMVCEKQEVVGSRLAVKKVCKTRQEWADLKMQDRQEIERVQTQRGMLGQ